MKIRIPLSLCVLLVLMSKSVLSQTAAADSARCAEALNAPTTDSAVVEEDAIFSPFDTTRRIPASYRAMLGQGLQEMLALPRPLRIDSYDSRARFVVRDPGRNEYATVAIRSFYRLALHRDGHLTNARVVGGVRNQAFDRAVIAALVALDSSGLLPPALGFDNAFDGDTLELHLTITNGAIANARGFVQRPARDSGVTPLFRLLVPVLAADRAVIAGLPANPYPKYPPEMRARGITGEVLMDFLIRADGSVDPESLHVQKATTLDFVKAVVAVVPQLHFYPLEVAGCKVASLAQVPFTFALNR